MLQKPGLLEKADEMLPAIQGTLVPLQFRFLEDDLENLRHPKGLIDTRLLPNRIREPMELIAEIDPDATVVPADGLTMVPVAEPSTPVRDLDDEDQ